MKIKDGFILRDIGDKTVVVATGEQSENFNGIIRLNATGKMFWEALSVGCEKEELVEKILSLYDIDRETATADVDAFIKKLEGADLIDR